MMLKICYFDAGDAIIITMALSWLRLYEMLLFLRERYACADAIQSAMLLMPAASALR